VRSDRRHSSFHTTIVTLEALQAWQFGVGRPERVVVAARRGGVFFAVHRLYRSHRTGEVVDPSFTRMVFPPGWRHDVSRGLDHFQAADAPSGPQLGDAVELLQAKHRSTATWTTNAPYPGRYGF
jgi:hypothetical protein